MSSKPFRWTKRNKNIRTLLNVGRSKEHIMKLVREGCEDNNWRSSEMAMHLADWSMAIDAVKKQLVKKECEFMKYENML